MNLIPIQILAGHCPPGREAELIVQYLTAQSLPEPDLRDSITRAVDALRDCVARFGRVAAPDVISDDTLESVKLAHVRRVIEASHTLQAAAERLDVDPTTLYRIRKSLTTTRERVTAHESTRR